MTITLFSFSRWHEGPIRNPIFYDFIYFLVPIHSSRRYLFSRYRVPGCGLGTGNAEEQSGHIPASGTDILVECY